MSRRAAAWLLLAGTTLAALTAQAEPAIERVRKTNAVRCGYVSYAPALVKDMKTGTWSGYDYEVMQAVARRLELKTDYAAETSWATIPADLDARKFDMLCSTYWVAPKAAKFLLYSRPVYFQPVYLIARADDHRFDKGIQAANDPALTLAAIDGDNPVSIAKVDFPNAKILTLPNNVDYAETLVSVASKKADFIITDAMVLGAYNAHNPVKLHIVDPAHPVRVYPASFGFQASEGTLRDAVNAALDELILDGTIDRILDRYEKYDYAFYRATIPYRNPYNK